VRVDYLEAWEARRAKFPPYETGLYKKLKVENAAIALLARIQFRYWKDIYPTTESPVWDCRTGQECSGFGKSAAECKGCQWCTDPRDFAQALVQQDRQMTWKVSMEYARHWRDRGNPAPCRRFYEVRKIEVTVTADVYLPQDNIKYEQPTLLPENDCCGDGEECQGCQMCVPPGIYWPQNRYANWKPTARYIANWQSKDMNVTAFPVENWEEQGVYVGLEVVRQMWVYPPPTVEQFINRRYLQNDEDYFRAQKNWAEALLRQNARAGLCVLGGCEKEVEPEVCQQDPTGRKFQLACCKVHFQEARAEAGRELFNDYWLKRAPQSFPYGYASKILREGFRTPTLYLAKIEMPMEHVQVTSSDEQPRNPKRLRLDVQEEDQLQWVLDASTGAHLPSGIEAGHHSEPPSSWNTVEDAARSMRSSGLGGEQAAQEVLEGYSPPAVALALNVRNQITREEQATKRVEEAASGSSMKQD